MLIGSIPTQNQNIFVTATGLAKTRVFLKKPSPVGFFGFYWVFFGFYWVFYKYIHFEY